MAEHCLNVLGYCTSLTPSAWNLWGSQNRGNYKRIRGDREHPEEHSEQQRLLQSREGYSKRNNRNTNTSSASFYHCTKSAPLGLTGTCGSAPLCFCKKNYASVPTKQEREEQNRKTKPVLDVQCTKREKKKNKEIPNEETKESAGGKNLQKTTGNINSARKNLSSSCFIAYFVSERAGRACQGCR